MSSRNVALALAALTCAGCGGGPSNQEIAAAVVAALPVVYLLVVGALWGLERIRAAADRAATPLGRELAVTAGTLAVAGAVVVATTRVPEAALVVLAVILYGALSLLVGLVTWRIRRRAPYANRILRAALGGVALGLPALVAAYPGLDRFTEVYTSYLALCSFGSIYIAPVVLLVLVVEAAVQRRRAAP